MSKVIRSVAMTLILFVGVMLTHLGLAKAGETTLVDRAARRFHSLTQAERRLLEYVDTSNEHRGEWAICGPNANPRDPANDPKNAATWGPGRNIRAELIRWLAADSSAAVRVDPKGVRVLGARIVGPLDLSQMRVPFPIALIQCSILERMNLESTKIPFFDLAGSYIGEVFGLNMVVDGDLDIGYDNNENVGNTWAFGEVYLEGVKISGSATFGGGHFVHSEVEPLGWGSEWKRALDLTRSDIKGELTLCCGFESHGSVLLQSAKIHQLDLLSSRLINPNNIALNALNAVIDTDVEWAPYQGPAPEADGEINFTTARVGTNFVVDRVRLEGKAGERHGLVARGLYVGKGFVWRDVRLENGALMDLRDARVGELHDEERSWPARGKLLLDGFTYDRFGSESPQSAESRLKWLRLEPGFYPQPYHQLENVLRNNGDDAGVRKVLIAQRSAQTGGSSIASDGATVPGLIAGHRLGAATTALLSPVVLIAVCLMLAALYYSAHLFRARAPGDHYSEATTGAHPSGHEAEQSTYRPDVNGKRSQTDRVLKPSSEDRVPGVFRREADYWTIEYRGTTFRMKDVKGLAYIAFLLAHPGERIHVHELVARVDGVADAGAASARELRATQDLGDAGVALDHSAQSDYRRQLRELSEDLAEAERLNDVGRVESIRRELDFISAELSAAVGVRGRDRKAAAHVERARWMVSKNIRSGLEKIRHEDVTLGRYFSTSIKTGYYCAYLPDPERTISWQL